MLWRYKETLVHIRGRERSPAPPSSQQETEPDITLSSVSCGVPGQQWPATGTRYLVAADLEDMYVAKVLLEEVAISSNIELPSKWPTYWRTIIPKKFLHCCKSSKAHNRFPYMGIQQKDWEFPGNLTLIRELPWDWGNRLLESTTKPCVHQDPGERSSDPHKRLSQTCLWVSIHRKVLNSVAWHIWLSLINSNL